MEQDMQSNDQSNMHWKTKLEDETAFAGELAGIYTAWDKLYNRMHQPKRKKIVWYWAAASLLIVSLVSVIVLSRHKTNIVTVKTLPVKQTEQQYIIDQKEFIVASPAEKMPVKKHVKHLEENKEKQTDESIIATPLIDKKEKAETVVLLPVEKKEDSVKTISTSLVAAKQKATLKVVHVNELGGNDENKSKQETDYSAIQFGVRSQPVNNNTTTQTKIGLNISTSKTSPTN